VITAVILVRISRGLDAITGLVNLHLDRLWKDQWEVLRDRWGKFGGAAASRAGTGTTSNVDGDKSTDTCTCVRCKCAGFPFGDDVRPARLVEPPAHRGRGIIAEVVSREEENQIPGSRKIY